MKRKIVILEDDQDIREMIEFVLIESGTNVEVRSYERAGKFMEVEHTDAALFLLDIMLPDGNGLDICCQLRKNKKTANIPIVLMSAHLNNTEGSDCIPADFITKPFDIGDFVTRVNRHLA